MEAVSSRLESFTKARRVKHSSTKRTVSLKWPHPAHFTATPNSLTEAGFFFNPSWDARDNVECFFCGKCLDGWEEQDDPHAIHWDKCRDTCAWAVVRCGINDDLDHNGSFASKDPSRQPDGKSMEKARLATFRLNDTWPHDHVKGHSANSTKMAKAGFVFTPQTPGDDTGTCLYCHVSLNGWDEDDKPLEEHRKRVKKSKHSCPFFPDAPAPKARSRTTSLRSTARPQSRADSRQLRSAASETSPSRSDDDSQPAPQAPPSRPARRSRTTSTVSTAKAQDSSDALRRSTRSSRAKPASEVEEDASGTEVRRSTLDHSLSKSSGKGKGKSFIEVIEEADEDDMPRAALPVKQRGKGKENVAHDVKVSRATRNTRPIRTTDTEEEAPQPKRRLPKRSRAALDVQEESPQDVDSESDVRHAGKQYRVAESVSSQEESAEEIKIKPKKVRATAKKTKAKPPIDTHKPEDEQQVDVTGGPSLPVKKALSKASRAKPEALEDSNEGSDDDPEEVGQTVKSLPSPDRGEDARSLAPLESPDAAASQSSEEAVIPFPASEKKGKSLKPVSATASNHERGRSRTITDSNDSPKPLMAKAETNAASGAARDLQNDVMDIDSDVASVPITPPRKKTIALPEKTSSLDVDSGVFAPRSRPRSPEHSAALALRREECPATPPPASSSLLSMSSTTSTTKVEGHTDTETLVEPVPLRTNGAQLTEVERMMTVEQWIRREIEVQYELLRRDGEMKIRLFKERAEEVRRQIEAL